MLCVFYMQDMQTVMMISIGVIDDKRLTQNLIKLSIIDVDVLEVLITLTFILRKMIIL